MKKIIAILALAAAPVLFAQQKSTSNSLTSSRSLSAEKAEAEKEKLAQLEVQKQKEIEAQKAEEAKKAEQSKIVADKNKAQAHRNPAATAKGNPAVVEEKRK